MGAKKVCVRGRFGGALKLIVLHTLSEGPLHAYGLSRRIEELTGFKPSSGSLYPILKLLVRKGLVTVEEAERDGKRIRVYRLSERGRELLLSHSAEVEKAIKFASAVRRLNELGLPRVFRLVEAMVENIDRLSDEQTSRLAEAISEFESRVLGILRAGEKAAGGEKR